MEDGQTLQIVVSVKAGHLVPNYVRDLRRVIQREEPDIGVLISFEEPSSRMRGEASEGRVRHVAVGHPHVTGTNVTLRRARCAQTHAPVALPLVGTDVEAEAEDE